MSSSRIAGAITKASHDQWALARRCQAAHIRSLETGIRTLRHRLSLPLGTKGTKRAAGGYRSKGEWFNKSRRLAALEARCTAAVKDWRAGRVRVVRGGKRLLNTRHHFDAAGLTEERWRERWEAERWFLAADGESGKRFGNETIRVTPDGQVSIKLPAPLAHLANTPHGRYTLAGTVAFAHRGVEWADRIEGNRAVAYRIHLDTARGRWYLTASWQRPLVQAIPWEAARAGGVIGVDTNADHFAAYRLDQHGNPVGEPHRFTYDLSGTTHHRDAQIRHALTRLLHWAQQCGVAAIGIEDLDFSAEKTREKHGRRKRFRQLVSGIPTGKLKARQVSMAAEQGLAIVAVDPAGLHLGVGRSALAEAAGHTPTEPHPDGRCPVTMPPVSRSGDAPSDTRSGVGRHRPHTTGEIVSGIGPPRPHQVHEGVREPAHPQRTTPSETCSRAGRESGNPRTQNRSGCAQNT